MKKIILLCTIACLFLCLANCTKTEIEADPLLKIDAKKKAPRSDGKWDALGFGYDVTKEYAASRSISTEPVLDIDRLEKEHPSKFAFPNTETRSFVYTYQGSSAIDFITDINRIRKFNVSGGIGEEKKPIDTGKKYYSGSINTSRETVDIKELKSRISYARHETGRHIKKIQFVTSITADFLKNYLATTFVNNLNTLSGDQIVAVYGTHVLLDFDLGGKLSLNFSANLISQTSTENKRRTVKAGLGFVSKLFNVNVSSEFTTNEMNKSFYESRDRVSYLETYGGSNSGYSFNVNAEGQVSESFNIAAWEASITPYNCVVTNINRMVPLDEFIDDPAKKAEIKAAIDRHIEARQLTELGELPIYQFYASSLSNHYFSADSSPTLENGQYVNEGISFYAFRFPKPGTVPIYSYYAPNITNHYLTKDNYPTLVNGQYQNHGIAFYAYANQVSGTEPVYQYYASNISNHFFTRDNSPTLVNGQYRNEGISFHAFGVAVTR